jgi:hypothetical protein
VFWKSVAQVERVEPVVVAAFRVPMLVVAIFVVVDGSTKGVVRITGILSMGRTFKVKRSVVEETTLPASLY